ncbi:MAG TPA: iron-sulfur cluster assembly scaffold protein, partial [candidate division Zixibacteria bacterium]|nr:iron-sulfur cluster assembly scaffold protein [candidate division Zixibacteria bacterium]
MYKPTVMDHFQNPRNTGDLDRPDGIGQVGNPACGDVMRIFIRVEA